MKRLIFVLLTIGLVLATQAFPAVRMTRPPGRAFIGLSTDTKPDTASVYDIVPGETFYETDTGIVYSWDGTDWQVYGLAEASLLDTLAGAGVTAPLSTNGMTIASVFMWAAGESVTVPYTIEGRATNTPWANLNGGDLLSLGWAGTDSSKVATYTELANIDSLRVRAYAVSTSDSAFILIRVAKELFR